MKTKEVKKLTPYERLLYWIRERTAIYHRKDQGWPQPWTDDEILSTYRFCNVLRERDTVTQWIKKNWRDPNTSDPNLWFAMVIARLFNLPSTLELIGYPTNFRPNKLLSDLASLKSLEQNIFNAAYIVSTNGRKMDKCQYVVNELLRPLWADRAKIQPVQGDTLDSFAQRLEQYNGMGTFMAAQVVADVKHAKGSPLNKAGDFWSWAAPGPGSKRGMNRLLGRPLMSPWGRAEWLQQMSTLRPKVEKDRAAQISAQDVQSCLCEFDKYERALWGEGRPKKKYVPAKG